MNVTDTMSEEKTRRIAMAPMCMVMRVALSHVHEEYVVAGLIHKEMIKWVAGGKVDKILVMRPTLHDEVSRAHKRFNMWEKKSEQDVNGKHKGRGPLYTFAALRALENAATACMNGDEGDLAEAIDDLDDIPLVPPPLEDKTKPTKIRVKKKAAPKETLADILRSLGEVFAVRPTAKGTSKAS